MKSFFSLLTRVNIASKVELSESLAKNSSENLLKKFIFRSAGIVAFLLVFGGSVWGQVNYTQTWAAIGLNGWTSQNGIFGRTTTAICATTGSVRANLYNFNATGNFASPSLTGNNAGLVTMSYQYKIINFTGAGATGNTFGTLKVQYSAALAGPWTDVPGSTISTGHTPSTSCATRTVTFSPPSGALFVRFNVVWGTGDYYMYFDEVSISQGAPPSCAVPTALTSSNVTSTSATISWTAASPAPASGYQYFYSTSATAPTAGTTPSGSTGAGVTTASITGLTANTTYYF
jgi:hypothetical protein